jgi:hypothetical protein
VRPSPSGPRAVTRARAVQPSRVMHAQEPHLGPVTKYAILGVVYGLVAGTLWATLSGQVAPIAGALGGFAGGLVGGTIWGAATRRLRAR